MLAAICEKSAEMRSRRKVAAIKLPDIGRRGTAYHELGPATLDYFGRDGIKVIVILGTAVPLLCADLHLVPDLKVAEIEMKAAGPTFVVMANDSYANPR